MLTCDTSSPSVSPIDVVDAGDFDNFPDVKQAADAFRERMLQLLADFRCAVEAFDNPEILNVVDDLEDDLRSAARDMSFLMDMSGV